MQMSEVDKLNKMFDSLPDELSRKAYLKKYDEQVRKMDYFHAIETIMELSKSKFSYLYYVEHFDTVSSYEGLIYDYYIPKVSNEFPMDIQEQMYQAYLKNQDECALTFLVKEYNCFFVREGLAKIPLEDTEEFIKQHFDNLGIWALEKDYQKISDYSENIYFRRELKSYLEKNNVSKKLEDKIRDIMQRTYYLYINSIDDINLKLPETLSCFFSEVSICASHQDTIEILRLLKEKNYSGNILINDQTLSFDINYIKELKKNSNSLIYYCQSNYFGCMSVDDILKADQRIDYYVEILNSKQIVDGKEVSLTPFEKYVAAYKIATLYGEYNEAKYLKYEQYNIYSIVSKDSKDVKIVCSGYVSLFHELLKRCGLSSNCFYTVSTDGKKDNHAISLSYLEDEKYGVNGLYISNPTEDSIDPAYEYLGTKRQNMHASFHHFFETIDEFKKYADETYEGNNDGMHYQTLLKFLPGIISDFKNGKIDSIFYDEHTNSFRLYNNCKTVNVNNMVSNNHELETFIGKEIEDEQIMKALIQIQKFLNKTPLEITDEEIERIKHQNDFCNLLTDEGKKQLLDNLPFLDAYFYKKKQYGKLFFNEFKTLNNHFSKEGFDGEFIYVEDSQNSNLRYIGFGVKGMDNNTRNQLESFLNSKKLNSLYLANRDELVIFNAFHKLSCSEVLSFIAFIYQKLGNIKKNNKNSDDKLSSNQK